MFYFNIWIDHNCSVMWWIRFLNYLCWWSTHLQNVALKPHSLFILTYTQVHRQQTLWDSPPLQQNRKSILTKDNVTSWRELACEGGVTATHTWSCEAGWLSSPWCPGCSSQCLPSPHAANMRRKYFFEIPQQHWKIALCWLAIIMKVYRILI